MGKHQGLRARKMFMREDKHIPENPYNKPWASMVGDESAVIPKSLNKNYVVRVWSKTWVSGTFQDAGYKQYIFPLGWKTFVWKKQFVPCDLHNIHYLLFCLNLPELEAFPTELTQDDKNLGGPNRWVSSTKETIRPVRPFKSLAPGHHGIKLVSPRKTYQ